MKTQPRVLKLKEALTKTRCSMKTVEIVCVRDEVYSSLCIDLYRSVENVLK